VVVAKVRRIFMSSAIFACLKNGRSEVKWRNKVCEMLRKAYGESAMKKQVFTSSLSVCKMAAKTLKMTNASVDPARQYSMKM
jgi:hypothetical protein